MLLSNYILCLCGKKKKKKSTNSFLKHVFLLGFRADNCPATQKGIFFVLVMLSGDHYRGTA